MDLWMLLAKELWLPLVLWLMAPVLWLPASILLAYVVVSMRLMAPVRLLAMAYDLARLQAEGPEWYFLPF